MLPLDRERIEAFVDRRADELRKAGSSPEALVAFIDRTYDLTDLASRPLLLKLMVDSAISGDLDVSDLNAQFGAAGLYEIYTHAKLGIDLKKGRTRRGGLSLETRRLLAEALAVEMYRQSVLEVDFHEMLSTLLGGSGPVRTALEDSGLSTAEIATDFATCSFVTLDEHGRCRSVHKSFRGFFVARVLKDRLNDGHPLLSQWLEREVLYFLGGFAPTQPGVGERLWAKFLHSDPVGADLRRDVLVAFLYSKPDHDTRRIAYAEIADAEFLRLSFVGARMASTTWRKCAVKRLVLDDVKWRGVHLVDTQVAEMVARIEYFEIAATSSAVESLELEATAGQLSLKESMLSECTLRRADVRLQTSRTLLGRIRVIDSRLHLSAPDDGASAPSELDAADSHVSLDCHAPRVLRATRSALVWGGAHERVGEWELTDCAVVLSADPSKRSGAPLPLVNATLVDGRSILLPNADVSPALLATVNCGVFGMLERATDLQDLLQVAPRAWGVLQAKGILDATRSLPNDAPGCRYGGLLLAKRVWHTAAQLRSGPLSAVAALRQFVAAAVEAEEPHFGERLATLVAEVRAQYDACAQESWPELVRHQ